MLEPHMKDDIHFTIDNFTDLYNLVQDICIIFECKK